MSKIFLIQKRNLRLFISSFIILFSISACTDFFEKDLNSSKVQLLAPVDNFKTSVSNITFWWNPLTGATKYHIQVVSPSFDSTQYIVLDSMTSNVSYTYTFVPGRYQWRVLAVNSSSVSENSDWSFIIDTTGLLTGDRIVLKSPISPYYTRDSIIHFLWYPISNATNYIFDLRLLNSNGANYMNDLLLNTSEQTLTLPEGIYYWSVQAKNNNSASLFSNAWKLVIDTTAPAIPKLVQPIPNSNDTFKLSDDKIFIWLRPSSSLAPIVDTIIISSDSLFNSHIDVSPVDTTFYKSLAIFSTGKYFWKVKSTDLAGNKSGFSLTARFIIK